MPWNIKQRRDWVLTDVTFGVCRVTKEDTRSGMVEFCVYCKTSAKENRHNQKTLGE